MDENTKLNWNVHASIRAPASVVKQLDDFKKKNGYTSRPQAIIAALERAEKREIVGEMKLMLTEFFEKEGGDIVQKSIQDILLKLVLPPKR